MRERFTKYLIPHLVGLAFIIIGWMIPIIDTGMDRLSGNQIWKGASVSGLVLIIIGAYIPETWISILKKKDKK